MLCALLGGCPLHADALESVPISYLPTRGLVDSLDARVDDPSLRRAVRLPDDFPLAGLVGDAVADLKLYRQDGGLCGFALLLGACVLAMSQCRAGGGFPIDSLCLLSLPDWLRRPDAVGRGG